MDFSKIFQRSKVQPRSSVQNQSLPKRWPWEEADKTRSWTAIISVLSATLLPAYAAIVYKSTGAGLVFWLTCALSLIFFTTSEILLYQIHQKKNRLEMLAWTKKMERLKNLPNSLLARDNLFFQVYQRGSWTRHAAPLALALYVILVSVNTTTIAVNLRYKQPLDYPILIFLLTMATIMTITLIAVVYNLFSSLKKMTWLSKLKDDL